MHIDLTYLYQVRSQLSGYPTGHRHGRCHLLILGHPEAATVICSELSNNPGTTITEVTEQIATQVTKSFGLDPLGLTWIEHFLPPLETYTLVELDWSGQEFSGPRWSVLSIAEVQSLTGLHLYHLPH